MQHKENMSGIFAKNQYKKIFKLQEMTEANNSKSNISLIFQIFVTQKKTRIYGTVRACMQLLIGSTSINMICSILSHERIL